MLIRQDELAPLIKRNFLMMRLHSARDGQCTCNDPNCHATGKHPSHGWTPQAFDDMRVFDGLNIGILTGQDVVVLDIDPRNGGTETLAALLIEHGPLPKTWTVETGGGGQHYYFAPPRPLKPLETYPSAMSLKGSGVELKGAGGYVVGPTSAHASGRVYEWSVSPEDCELAPLPFWVEQVCKPLPHEAKTCEGNTELERYTREEIADAVSKLDANMGYHEWVAVGMGIKSAGLPFSLWDSWSATGSKYPGTDKLAKKWSSFRGNGVGIGTIIHMAKEAGWEPQEAPDLLLLGKENPVTEPERKATSEGETCAEVVALEAQANTALRHTAQGLIREMACWLYDNAIRSYDEFSVASALSVMSAVAQGSWLSPSGRSLSLYQICLLAASGGKDHYLRSAVDILDEVDSRLTCSSAGSSHGLRGELYSFNSRMWAIDEVQDFFAKTSKTDNVFVSQILSDLKELHNGVENWKGQVIKGSSVPSVKSPRMTLLGFGTPKKFKETINSNNVGGGLLSRFCLWEISSPVKEVDVKLNTKIDKMIISKLRKLFNDGLTEHGKEGFPKMLEMLKLYQTGKAEAHNCQTKAMRKLGISEKGLELMREYRLECQDVYLKNPEDPGAAIIDRAASLVEKIASLHCLGCERETVDEYDVRWALSVVKKRVYELSNISNTWMSDTAAERDRNRIIESMKKCRGNVGQRDVIMRSLRMSAKEFDSRVSDLVEMGMVQCELPGNRIAISKNGAWPKATLLKVLDLASKKT